MISLACYDTDQYNGVNPPITNKWLTELYTIGCNVIGKHQTAAFDSYKANNSAIVIEYKGNTYAMLPDKENPRNILLIPFVFGFIANCGTSWGYLKIYQLLGSGQMKFI